MLMMMTTILVVPIKMFIIIIMSAVFTIVFLIDIMRVRWHIIFVDTKGTSNGQEEIFST